MAGNAPHSADRSLRERAAASPWSRRMFLGASVGTAVGCVAAAAQAHVPPGRLESGQRRPRLNDPILFLVNHITPGFSQPTYQTAKQLGYLPFLEWQLAPEAISDAPVDQFLTQFASLPMSHQELYEQYTQNGLDSVPYYELKAATVYRAAFSARQLFERMVEFWSNHFSIYHDKVGLKAIKTVDDREVIRQHALGKFPDMLVASAHSGAMLVYLDNYLNVVGSPNENYARELLELHTLGVHGGYTEADVKEVARCLTGWTIQGAPSLGAFAYDDSQHDQGSKTVLGQVIPPNGGQQDGETVLQMLALHPSTAAFVARKLCRWLLAYEPDAHLVARVAAMYLSTGGDIKAMIRVIMDPWHIRSADVFDQVKFRTPYHFVITLLRATQAEVTDLSGLLSALQALNHYPFGWVSPDGYPDQLAAWTSSLLPRWSFASDLMNKQIHGTTVKWAKIQELLGDVPDDQLGEAVNRILAGGAMARGDVFELQAYIDYFPPPRLWPAMRQVLAVAASCASHQYY
ncbi:MAG: DUF1800 domain-containing protein [Planctomycetota bacterium]